jgi:hypothetical protein
MQRQAQKLQIINNIIANLKNLPSYIFKTMRFECKGVCFFFVAYCKFFYNWQSFKILQGD